MGVLHILVHKFVLESHAEGYDEFVKMLETNIEQLYNILKSPNKDAFPLKFFNLEDEEGSLALI